MSYHLDRHRQSRELLHQAEIAARQEMRLRFFRKREAAAHRQMHGHYTLRWEKPDGVNFPKLRLAYPEFPLGIALAVAPQQNRNKRLGIA